jgi:hypothetical protein
LAVWYTEAAACRSRCAPGRFMTVVSALPEAMRLPSGLNATLDTWPA